MLKTSSKIKRQRNRKLCIAGIVFLFLIILLFLYSPILIPNSSATLIYNVNDENINIVLTEEESYTIKNIFKGKQAFISIDDLSCGFDNDAAVKFGLQTFCPACDGCSVVKYYNKYFTISDQERQTINSIFEKYGVILPYL